MWPFEGGRHSDNPLKYGTLCTINNGMWLAYILGDIKAGLGHSVGNEAYGVWPGKKEEEVNMKRLSLVIAIAVALPCILFGTYASGGTGYYGTGYYHNVSTEVDPDYGNDESPEPEDSDVVLSNVRVIRVHLTGKDYCAAKTTVGNQIYFAEAESDKINISIACSMFVSALENGRSLELVGTMDGPRHIKVRKITYGLARRAALHGVTSTAKSNKIRKVIPQPR